MPSRYAVVTTIKRQLDALAREQWTLGQKGMPAGVLFVAFDERTLKVSRGERGVLIHYNAGTDLYDLERYEGLTVSPLADGVYADNLLIAIQGVL